MTWDFLRRHRQAPVEKLVSLSVGSSFRYDLGEHGLGAFTWLYAALNSLGYYLPLPGVRVLPGWLNTRFAGYRSAEWASVYLDIYHYWYGPLVPFQTLFRLFGLGKTPEYTDFHFPVLYIRSPMDRIASTAAFEHTLSQRPDCRLRVWPEVNHWFPEQQAERVLAEIRTFI
jgi:pimeloyl-ACP methyl ester carboxylesterase